MKKITSIQRKKLKIFNPILKKIIQLSFLTDDQKKNK